MQESPRIHILLDPLYTNIIMFVINLIHPGLVLTLLLRNLVLLCIKLEVKKIRGDPQ